MKVSRRHLAILFCCTTCLVKPAYAFLRVFSLLESRPLVTEVTTSLESLSEAKKQLTEIDNCIKAIGDAVNSLSEFSQSLGEINNAIIDVANSSVGMVNENLGTNITVQDQLTGALNNINDVQSQMTKDFVDQTNGAISTVKDYSDKAMSGINQAQEVGKKVDGFVEDYNKKNNPENVADVADAAKDAGEKQEEKKGFWDKVNVISDKVSDVAKDADKSLGEIGDAGLIDTSGVQSTVNKTNNKQEDAVKAANQAHTEYQNYRNKKKNKGNEGASEENAQSDSQNNNESGAAEPLEEEEEEEEVENVISDDSKEEIMAGFSAIKEENKQLAVELNDALDTMLEILNQTGEENRKAFQHLKQTLNETKEISTEQKNALGQKLETLNNKEQEVSERMISLVEGAKDRYNAEYTTKLEDRIKNYEKLVLAYLSNTIDKAEVLAAGEQLKKGAASIDVVPDAGVMESLKKQALALQKELENFANEVKNAKEANVQKI